MIGAEHISRLASPVAAPAAKTDATLKGAAQTRLKDMAKEFEATFLSMLLKEMRQSMEPDGGLFPGDTGDVQGGLFDLYLSRHLADAGGIGVAAQIVRQMQAAAPAAAKSESPNDLVPRQPASGIPAASGG